jgi:hypothetical protein
VPCTEHPGQQAAEGPAAGWHRSLVRRRLLQAPIALWPVAAGLTLAGCAQRPAAVPAPAPAVPAKPAAPPAPTPSLPAAPAAPAPPTAPGALPPPVAARTWHEFRVQAALRLMAANPGRVYDGPVPDPLLAIPVLEVELHADGRVRAIKVLRQPTQARDTVQLAIAAVRRAAPFGSVQRLPRPWRFVEVFLFDDERRFKPRTLDI